VSSLLRIAPEVDEALAGGGAVVALETAFVSHGFPAGEGGDVARDAERRVRLAGAVPATIGVIDGVVKIGLGDDELERFSTTPDARKLGPRDLAACAVQRALGATTAGATLAVCRLVGIRAFATGGIGGVHRGFARLPDVSADLAELARSPVLLVCSGVKSLLDVPATAELLESLGVPVLGWQTEALPLFYAAGGGPTVSARVETAAEAGALARAHWELGRESAVVLARPELPGLDADWVESLIESALADAEAAGIHGQAVTPFVLSRLHEASGGKTLTVNREVIAGNAALAAEVAGALLEDRDDG
jgi:pseudouridine-5'-phosphate glycosidase